MVYAKGYRLAFDKNILIVLDGSGRIGRVYFDIDSLPFLDFALISFYKVQQRCLNTGNFYGYTLRLRFWYPYYWLFEAHRSANVRDLNMQLTQVLNQLEGEKKRGEALTQMKKASQAQYWWAAPIEELSFEQLELLKVSLENLKRNVEMHADKHMMEASNPLTFFLSSSVGAGVPYDAHIAAFDPLNFNFGYGGHLH
uniref:Agamous-like MADS-box protein AGL62 n=1 Tax=Vitis vinifera TaxID=29760 RepID=A5BY25_VITVI|nr:hypothetical protein VITISV_011788 [Vitis vinifera]